MPRPRKSTKFAGFLSDLDLDDLRTLKSEVGYQIRTWEKAAEASKRKGAALKMRDRLKIGQRITYKQRGGVSVKTEIFGIFADKVQVLSEGKKKSIPLVKIESIE